MASFTAFLDVGGKNYPLFRYEMSMHQETDTLGRPASPVLGGTIICTLSSPGQQDPFLYQWMMNPTMQQDGRIRLLQDAPKATEKTISFFNAYCTGLDISFQPGQSGGAGSNGMPSSFIQIQISPQRVAVGAIVHDNNWPLPSHGSGESFTRQQAPTTNGKVQKEEEPSAFMEGVHGVLDVVGMIPVIGEVADAANAVLYASQGRYAEAAMSAASMIPLAGNVVGAAKLARRGAQLLQKARKLAPPKLLSKLDKGAEVIKKVCQKDPVDVATGMMLTQRVDFELPGPISFIWERSWFSASDYAGILGHGWHHRYDWGLTLDESTSLLVLRNSEGRHVAFDLPQQPGQPVFDRASGLTLYPPAPDDPAGMPWRIWHRGEQVWYVFAQPRTGGAYQPLHAIANTQGQRIEFEYNASDQLIQLTDSTGRVLQCTYSEQGLLTSIDGPDPDQPSDRMRLVTYTHDDAGDLVAFTDAENHTWQYQYRHHLMMQTITPNGLSFYWEYDGIDSSARCIHTWGDGGIHEGRFTYLDEQTTLMEDTDGLTRYEHHEGLVTRKVDVLGGVWQYAFTEVGELAAETDPLGATTRYGYDEVGNRVWMEQPDGHRVQMAYDEWDRPVLYSDQLGSRWQYDYNQQGLLARQTNPLGDITEYAYDEQGHLTSLTNALGQPVYFRYDEQHQIRHFVTPATEPDQALIHSRAYDALGRLITLTDPAGAIQRRSYDRLGHLVQLVEPDGSEQTLAYDGEGNIVEARRGEQVVQLSYVGAGQLAQRRQAGQVVQFHYDREGRLTGLTNEANEAYRFEWDALGQVVLEQGFDGSTRRYERDAVGRVLAVLRPGNQRTDYDYDRAGQVVRTDYSDGTWQAYAYDAAGRLVQATTADTSVELERDALGQVLSERQNGQVIYNRYDALGQRTALASSMGANVGLTVDEQGQIAQMRTGDWRVQFNYDNRGLETGRSYTNGVRHEWQYDLLGRPLLQTVASSLSVRQRAYTWNRLDELTRLDDSLTGVSQFRYDAIGTLIAAQYGQQPEQLRLADAVGNLFERAIGDDRQYGPGGQLQQLADGTRYHYDAEGNLTRKTQPDGGQWQYAWDGAGQLTSVQRPDGYTVRFQYDALGRRVRKHFRGRTIHWLWDGDKLLHEWAELTVGSGATASEELITWLFEEDGFTPIAKLQGQHQYSVVADHVGTPLALYDENGQAQWSVELDAYGRRHLKQGQAGDCPFRYQGQYEDVETGLYYNRFRYYDPQQGGYISQDPIGLAGGILPQGYVADPNTQVDVLGLSMGSTTLGNRMERAGMTHGIPTFPRGDFRAHHVIPHEVWTSNQSFFDSIGLGKKANGFNPKDAAANGVFLPKSQTVGQSYGFDRYHSGSHGGFNRQMDNSIRDVSRRFNAGTITRTQARKEVSALQKEQRKLLSARNNLPCSRLS